MAGLHPTRSAHIRVGERILGALGEIDPGVLEAHGIGERVAYLEVDLDALLAVPHGGSTYRPFSVYPSSDIDLAFEVADDVPASAVEDAIRAAAGELLWSVRLFDVYRGTGVADGHRSLAYTLRFQAPDRTLTEADVARARTAIIDAVESAVGALRGDPDASVRAQHRTGASDRSVGVDDAGRLRRWPTSRAFSSSTSRTADRDLTAPLVVALDGRSGAGKSTLARAVAEAVGASIVDGDDFYAGGSGETWDAMTAEQKAAHVIDWRRQRPVLEALRRGEGAAYHPYDWDDDGNDGRAPHLVTVEPAPVVILDGAVQRPTGAGRPARPARPALHRRRRPPGTAAGSSGRALPPRVGGALERGRAPLLRHRHAPSTSPLSLDCSCPAPDRWSAHRESAQSPGVSLRPPSPIWR